MSVELLLDDLFEVQRRALEEGGDKSGFAYFCEQGLGKTRIVLYEFHDKVRRGLADVLVIICPRTLRGAWRDEAVEIGLDYPTILYTNEKTARAELNKIGRQPLLLIMNYEQVLYSAYAVVSAILERRRKVYMALDESVRVKSHSSVMGERIWCLTQGKEKVKQGNRTVVVDITAKRSSCAFVRVLSGTPAPQGPHDLWNQFRIIGAMPSTPYFAFRNLYCRMGGFEGKQVLGSQNLDLLRDRTGKFAFRAKKSDWADLPEKTWMPIREISMTKEQREQYLSMVHEFVVELGSEEYVTVEMMITAKMKLQQIASGWIFDNNREIRELVPLDLNPKLQEARSILEDIETKSLAFYFFKPTRAYLDQLAAKTGYGYVFLESGLSDSEFDRRKRMFNEDDDIKWAFCQTEAVKEGHTLLGTKRMPCHNSLFIENTYSLYARAQAEDRNHRHGQKFPVNYWDIACCQEDKKTLRALQKKRNDQETLLSEFTAYRETGAHFDV